MITGRTKNYAIEHASIPFGNDSLELKLHTQYHRAIRGAREGGSGLQLEPDEPAWVEVVEAFVEVNGEWERVPDWMFSMIAEEDGAAYKCVQEQIEGA